MTHKISGDGKAAVDPKYHWLDLDTAPKGKSVWLLTRHGVGIHGQYNGQNDIVAWCPKPKIPAHIKALMK